MAKKGLVTQRSEARTLYYSPNYSPEQASSQFLHKVFDGAVDELVLHMIRAEGLSDDELRQLERLIAEARRKGRRQGK
jgi:predicted transcriptional regulator